MNPHRSPSGQIDDPLHVESAMPTGRVDDPLHVESANVPFGLILRLFILGWALSVLIPVGLIIGLRWHDQDQRLSAVSAVANETHLLADRLRDTQRQLKTFVAQQCLNAETRDVANVQTNLAILTLLKNVPNTPAMRAFKQSLLDSNAVLEPPGEKDCQPGPGDQNP